MPIAKNFDNAGGIFSPSSPVAAASIIAAARKYIPLSREFDALHQRAADAEEALWHLQAAAKRGPEGQSEAWRELHDLIVEAVKGEGQHCIIRAGGGFFVVDPGEKTTSVEWVDAVRFFDLDAPPAEPPAPLTLEDAARAYLDAERAHVAHYTAADRLIATGEEAEIDEAKGGALTDAVSRASKAIIPFIAGPDGTGRAATVDGRLYVIACAENVSHSQYSGGTTPELVLIIEPEAIIPAVAVNDEPPRSRHGAKATLEDMDAEAALDINPPSYDSSPPNRRTFFATEGLYEVDKTSRVGLTIQDYVAYLLDDYVAGENAHDITIWERDRVRAAIRPDPTDPSNPKVVIFG